MWCVEPVSKWSDGPLYPPQRTNTSGSTSSSSHAQAQRHTSSINTITTSLRSGTSVSSSVAATTAPSFPIFVDEPDESSTAMTMTNTAESTTSRQADDDEAASKRQKQGNV